MALKDVGVRLVVEGSGKFKTEMDAVDKKVADLKSGILEHSRLIGTGMTAMGTAIVGAFALATKAAIDFEDAFAGVRKTVDATDAELGVLRQGLRDMTRELPLTHSELARIAEAAGQLGIQKEGILDFTEVMAKLGLTTNLTGDEAATTFARFANITGMDVSFFDNLGSVIVELGNNMATTEGEIASMALRLAGASTIIGLTQAEILALAASLSSVGIEAESGGTAFSRVMLEMNSAVASGGDILKIWASVAGTSVEEFSKLFKKDASGAVLKFIDGLGAVKDMGIDVIPILDKLGLGGIRITDALLRATGAQDLFREATEIANKAWEENNALDEEAAKRLETTKSQLNILKNSMIDLGITIGDFIIPKLTALIDKIKPVIDNVQQWIKDNPKLSVTIITVAGVVGGLLLALGPLLIMLPTIITSLGLIKAGILAVAAASRIATVAQWLWNAALWANPIGLIILAVVAFAAAMVAAVELIRRNWDGIAEFFGKIWKNITTFVKNGVNMVIDYLNSLINALNIVLGLVGISIPRIPRIGETFSRVGGERETDRNEKPAWQTMAEEAPGFIAVEAAVHGLEPFGAAALPPFTLPERGQITINEGDTIYNVEANYTTPQDPATIALDLEALTLAVG